MFFTLPLKCQILGQENLPKRIVNFLANLDFPELRCCFNPTTSVIFPKQNYRERIITRFIV
jgi:hypothetical protein